MSISDGERAREHDSPSEQTSRDAPDPILFSKLKWLMFVRLLLATALFASAVVVQIREGGDRVDLPLLYTLIVMLYGCSALYAFLLKRIGTLVFFAYFQFFVDTLFISLLIYVTGGVESIFSFLYFLIIISASYLLYTPGAFSAATMGGICYGTLVGFQASGMLPEEPGYVSSVGDMSYVFYNITINVFAFYLVAFLSSYLAEQLKQTREALIEEQQSLQELEEFNRGIVENIHSGIMTIDSESSVTSLNTAASLIIGRSKPEILGRHVSDVFDGISPYLEAAAEKGRSGPSRWEQRFVRKGTPPLDIAFGASPLLSPDNRQLGLVLIFEDQTRLKYLEEKGRRDDRLKTIGRLAAGIAHEIRNPLASISGSIQLMSADMDPESEDRALMDIVLRETDRLNGLITDFLQYVRQRPVVRKSVEIQKLVQHVLDGVSVNPKFSEGIRIVTQFGHHSPIEADADQLEQVFWNLFLNAVESMHGGGVLTVATRALDDVDGDPSPRVLVSISDTGVGISKAELERIFDPFFSTKPGGTGLGLAVAEKAIQAHDGLIRVQSEEGNGTEFEIILPVRPQSHHEVDKPAGDLEAVGDAG